MKYLFLVLSFLMSLSACQAEEITATPRPFEHVLYIVLENTNYADAIADPYLSELSQKGALFTNFTATTHPSYPNYLSMVAGDTLGAWTDFQINTDATSIADLLEAKGLTWKNYAENYPGNCFLGTTSGKYARRHAPFVSFKSIQRDPARCARIVDASELNADIGANNLPSLAFYSPNVDDDGHNTSLRVASAWLKGFLEPILSNNALMKDTLVILTFDESASASNNQIYTVFLGGMVKAGSTVSARTDFYSVLRTIEDGFSLGTLGRNDSKREAVKSIWISGD